jgi:membrane glycosyltransferase
MTSSSPTNNLLLDPAAQQVLGRVLAYLHSVGIAENRIVARDALQLVQEAFASDTTDLYAYVMERLPQRIPLPDIHLPPSMLPVERGSIGYTDDEIDSPSAAVPLWRNIVWMRRTILTLLVLAQTALAIRFALVVLPYHGGDALEIAIVCVFAILFTWISIGFWMAIYGFVLRRFGGDKQSLCRRHPDEKLQQVTLARTAIVLPIYHEPIERTLGGLRAVFLSLKETGQLEHFDFFILSDSRSPDVWLAEQATWYQLVQELQAEGKLFYRRRSLNMHYKSGNVADFLRRWGRKYEYSVVLDADSLMAGETLVKMVRLMQCEPRVGILQSAPTLVNAKSLFARIGGITLSFAIIFLCVIADCDNWMDSDCSRARSSAMILLRPPAWVVLVMRCGLSLRWRKVMKSLLPRWKTT